MFCLRNSVMKSMGYHHWPGDFSTECKTPLLMKKCRKTSDIANRYPQFVSFICIFLVFLSTTLIQPICANNLPANDSALATSEHPSTVPADDSTLRISSLSFSAKLRNPCQIRDPSLLRRSTLNMETLPATQKAVVSHMKALSESLKECAQTLLASNILQDCQSLDIPTLGDIPSPEGFSNRSVDALYHIYPSLINHTAHVYFILDQLHRHSSNSAGRCERSELADEARRLSSGLTELVCVLRLSILSLQNDNDYYSFDNSTNQILNEQLISQFLCSRRSVRNCQTVCSTIALLQQFYSYLNSTVLIADSNSAAANESNYRLVLLQFAGPETCTINND